MASNKKEEKKTLQRVTQGETRLKKKTLGEKFQDTFVSENSHSVLDYVIFDVLIPAAKSTLYDMVDNGLHMMLYGTSGNPGVRKNGKNSSGTKISYNRYYGDSDNGGVRRANMSQSGFQFENVSFENRADAIEVLECLKEQLDPVNGFGMVSVANFYEAAGIRDNYSYINNDWGWYDLNNAYVDRLGNSNEFIIRFPKPSSLK